MPISTDGPSGLRPIRPEDSPAVIDLVSSAYDEYEGCVLDLPGVDDDLPVLAQRWAAAGGGGWVVDRPDVGVVAVVGWAPVRAGVVELKRLYVSSSARGRGLGSALATLVLAAASEHGAELVELWSDTRFLDAHRLYERVGFERQPETRDLHDPSDTTEYRYTRSLGSS